MRRIPLRVFSRALIAAGIAALTGCTALLGPAAGDRAITGLTASTDRTAEVRLDWDEVGGSPVYRVYRDTTEEAEPTLYRTTAYPELIDRSVDKNRDYYYRVSIVDPRSGIEGPLTDPVAGRRGDTAQSWENTVSLGTVLQGIALDAEASSAAEGLYALAASGGDPQLHRYLPASLDWTTVGPAVTADSLTPDTASLVLTREAEALVAVVASVREDNGAVAIARLLPDSAEPEWETLGAPGGALTGREVSEIHLLADPNLDTGNLVVLARASDDGSSATSDDGILYHSRWTGSAWTPPVAIDAAANAEATRAVRWSGSTWVAALVDISPGDGDEASSELRLIELGDNPGGAETAVTDFIDGVGADGERQWLPQTLSLAATPSDSGALVIGAALDPADAGGIPLRVSSGNGTVFTEVSPDPGDIAVSEPAGALGVLAGDGAWVLAYPDAETGSLLLLGTTDDGITWQPIAPPPTDEDGEEEQIAPAGAADLRIAGSDTAVLALGWSAGFTGVVRIYR